MSDRNQMREIIPQMYQRGKILTWPCDKKIELIQEYNIGIIVNFWTKLDPDLSEMDLDAYFFIPVFSSSKMVNLTIDMTAGLIARYITDQKKSVLILCEAGVTRSVFFTGLVLYELGDNDPLRTLNDKVPNQKMKDYMIDYLRSLSDTKGADCETSGCQVDCQTVKQGE